MPVTDLIIPEGPQLNFNDLCLKYFSRCIYKIFIQKF